MSEEPSGEDPPPSYDEVMRGNMIDDQDLMTETISAPTENEVVVIPEENVGNGNDETQQNVNATEKIRNYVKFIGAKNFSFKTEDYLKCPYFLCAVSRVLFNCVTWLRSFKLTLCSALSGTWQ